jgi:glycosyltransferase involved in cell wall biosynthesis
MQSSDTKQAHPPRPAASPPLLSVVIPVYREGGHMRTVLAEVSAALVATGCAYEIVLVDDGSPDTTWAEIRTAAPDFATVRAFRLSRNFGKESALCAGLERARGDAVIVMDGDLQHPPALIPQMVCLWRDGSAEIVEAVKTDRGAENLIGKLGAALFYATTSRLSGVDMRGASDFKLLDRRAVDAWLQMDERNVFFRGTVAWLGFRRTQVPFAVAERAGGRSSWSYLRRIKLALTGITAFSAAPLHLVTIAGLLFSGFAVLLAIETLINLLIGNAVSGFTTVILLQLIIGSLLMLGLGVIGEYIARIYEEVKHRPRYLIAEAIDDASKPSDNG